MTPSEFRGARRHLGLSAAEMASLLGLADGRTIRRYEAGDIEISGPVERLTRWLAWGQKPKPERSSDRPWNPSTARISEK